MGPTEMGIGAALILSALNIVNTALILKDKFNAPDREKDRRITLLEDDVRDLKRNETSSSSDIDNLKSANKMIIKSMSALLTHGIDGNNADEMKLAREELNDYLLGQLGGK